MNISRVPAVGVAYRRGRQQNACRHRRKVHISATGSAGVMLDKRYPGTDALLKTLPSDSDLHLLYQDKTHAAYEILP